ncbi:helix-turn-helix transcriptional regulator [Aureimonas psammosilenae]|uniref:helix-turn-helix transcriptional regulator n=1 Tax=Aureimonas psammosilenae TaxID=2495496 RepID=UPI0012611ED7|nr:LuxR family transcriptional regulator [Aureimonas psammosilenae]
MSAAAILEALPTPWDETLLHDALKAIIKAYGYTHYAIFTIPSPDDVRAELKLILGNWTPEFQKGYEKLGLQRYSPVIRAVKAGPTPFVWDLESLFPDDEPTPTVRFLTANGIRGGVFVPVHGMSSFAGALGLYGERTDLSAREACELQFASFGAFGILAACRLEENRRSNPLTPRERDCLKLAMLGKTSSEIGIILSLSEYTVSQYLTAATRKMNASNRTHAVAIAAQMGYLS